jgi:hypothetical protein
MRLAVRASRGRSKPSPCSAISLTAATAIVRTCAAVVPGKSTTMSSSPSVAQRGW